MELRESIHRVNDAESFLDFVRQLIADRADEVEKEKVQPSSPYGSGANGWENKSVEAFLEAAIAWAEDSHFIRNQVDAHLKPWQQFANFLYAGKIYE